MSAKSLYILILYTIFTNGEGFKNFEVLQEPEKFSVYIEKYLGEQDNKLSGKCAQELEQYSKILPFKLWALLMFDATSKIPAGVLYGNTGDLGAYDQCLNIKGNTTEGVIYGKYCLGIRTISIGARKSMNYTKTYKPPLKFNTIGINNVLRPKPIEENQDYELYFATCTPASCSAEEVQELYTGMGLNIQFTDYMCSVKMETELSTRENIAVILFSVMLGVVLVSTTYDLILFYINKKPVFTLLVALSIMKTGKTLITSDSNQNHLVFLHGLRAISIMWIILVHKYYTYNRYGFPASSNYLDYSDSIERPYNMYILGGQLSIDTFLLLSGLLVSYCYMVSVDKGEKFAIWKHYLRRYLRLTPALASVVLVYATIFKHIGSGPFWVPISEHLIKSCEDYWWSTLLYVQNYVNPTEMCIEQAWYFSIDMQLFLLSPIFLILLGKKPKLAIIALSLLTIGTTLASALIVWFYEIRPMSVINEGLMASENYNSHYHITTHTRAAPWLIGFILGYIIYKTKKAQLHTTIKKVTKLKILNKRASLQLQVLFFGLWGISLAVMVACVFGPYENITGKYSQIGSTLHLSLVKPVWSIAVGWLIFACAHGHGGPISWFLSLPILQFVSKLSYSMYLLHLLIMSLTTFTKKSGLVFGELDMLYSYWGDFIFTVLLSVVWVLVFEYPVETILQMILGKRRKDATSQHKNNTDENAKETA